MPKPRKAFNGWNARCKSGYAYNGKTCKQVCKRGMLLCSDCFDAVIVPDEAEPTAILDGFFNRLRAYALAVVTALVEVRP